MRYSVTLSEVQKTEGQTLDSLLALLTEHDIVPATTSRERVCVSADLTTEQYQVFVTQGYSIHEDYKYDLGALC